MYAKNIMTYPVITVTATTGVAEIAALLASQRVSAVPVVDDAGHALGIVSEGDLIRRAELGTAHVHRRWWEGLLGDSAQGVDDYIKTHGHLAADVMTAPIVTAAVDTPLHGIVATLTRTGIKRLPVVDKGIVVGILSRADIVRALSRQMTKEAARRGDGDQGIHRQLTQYLMEQGWSRPWEIQIDVQDGRVTLSGFVRRIRDAKAYRVAAECIAGVKAVDNRILFRPRIYHEGI